jgi:hypothetical protein
MGNNGRAFSFTHAQINARVWARMEIARITATTPPRQPGRKRHPAARRLAGGMNSGFVSMSGMAMTENPARRPQKSGAWQAPLLE